MLIVWQDDDDDEISLSSIRKGFTFLENMFNRLRRLTCRTLRWLFLFEYERVSEFCVANTQSRYNDLFLNWFSESWSPFSQSGLDLEEYETREVQNITPINLYLKKKQNNDTVCNVCACAHKNDVKTDFFVLGRRSEYKCKLVVSFGFLFLSQVWLWVISLTLGRVILPV